MADGSAVNVEAVLNSAERDAKERFKPIEVSKDIDPVIDSGNLLSTDLQPIDVRDFRKGKETFLQELARDNTQILFNNIWKLPTERVEGIITVKLPEPTTVLPREKPVPTPKAPTKWEQFAKTKGIQKKKRERMIWDEASKQWKPRFGYKRGADGTNEWLIEVPKNADPYEDQFEKRMQAKKEHVAKNEYQRLRNIASNKKVKVPNKDLAPANKQTKQQLKTNINIARSSTASFGKFTSKLPKEKLSKKTGKKRKFEPVVGSMANERSRSLAMASKIAKRDPLDINKAVSQHTVQSEKRAAENNRKGGGKKGSVGKGKMKGKGQSAGKKSGQKAGRRK